MILTIVGAGLIGTSFARAVRDRFERINAVEPDAEHARTILAANDVDAVVCSNGMGGICRRSAAQTIPAVNVRSNATAVLRRLGWMLCNRLILTPASFSF